MYYVYILKCVDKRTYIGSTNDLKDRIKRHQLGYILATKNRFPIKLIAYFAFSSEETARNFEKYLKLGSGRAFLERQDSINGLFE